ncbi:MAG TPA: alpha/beta hydrolase [Jatrophihabitantaceae bacterium]
MPTVSTPVLAIDYDDRGDPDASPVLLLHGWPDCPHGWRQIADSLVAAGYRTVIPANRGTGATRFHDPDTPRDGSGPALARDVLDLADALGLVRFAVVGHDWGARVGYTLGVVAPERVISVAALALAYQPGGRFAIPEFSQARSFWYQWLMYVEAGAAAVADDPIGFARYMWQTWSPPGWWTEDDFAAAATDFANLDWVAITLSAYRSRFRADEPRDPRYDDLRATITATEQVTVPTLMIQGGADLCDEPSASEGLGGYFNSYRRVVLPGVGHFPHRERPDLVITEVVAHLGQHRRWRRT